MYANIKSGIYTITNSINGKMYVGYATNLDKRKSGHFSDLSHGVHGNMYLQNAVLKYGIKNFIFEVLEECKEEFLASQENYWCYWLNTHDHKYGYNLRSTDPGSSFRHSPQTIKKLCNSIKGKRGGKDNPFYGKKHSEFTKEKMRITKLSKRLSPEVITQMRKDLSEREHIKMMEDIDTQVKIMRKKFSDKTKYKTKKVLKYDLQGNFIEEYKSRSDAARSYNLEAANICAAIRKKSTCAGFLWADYSEDFPLKISLKVKKQLESMSVLMLDKDTYEVIKEFRNAGVAKEVLHAVQDVTIRTAARKGCGFSLGYRWIYKKDYKLWSKEKSELAMAS